MCCKSLAGAYNTGFVFDINRLFMGWKAVSACLFVWNWQFSLDFEMEALITARIETLKKNRYSRSIFNGKKITIHFSLVSGI